MPEDDEQGPEDPSPTLPSVPLNDIMAMAQMNFDFFQAYVNVGFTPEQALQILIALVLNGAKS